MPNIDRVDIRPGVSMLSILSHLNYKPWFALAEFVDNAVQSYLANKDELEKLHGADFKLKVKIEINSSEPTSIKIKDNAAGISHQDFPRAFRPAAVPVDRSGLSEFGMGMKSAACWFAPNWEVRTKALDEDLERHISFDINKIVNDEIDELEIKEATLDANEHFTEVTLLNLHSAPVKKTLAKIKDYLTDIYRVYMRDDLLELYVGGEILNYEEPNILNAPYALEEGGDPKVWSKDINFDLGGGMSVTGFAALSDPGNQSKAGLSLFRRKRLIQGTTDEGYKPEFIFGKPNSFRSSRLFGELHLEGFEVSHTKDGFRWDENEEPFLELLYEHLNSEDLPLLKQADNYRALAARKERKEIAQDAVDNTADVLEKNLPAVLPQVADKPPIDTQSEALDEKDLFVEKELKIKFRDRDWTIKIELTDDPAEGEWLSVSDQSEENKNADIIEIRLSVAHPFMVNFVLTDSGSLEALVRIAAGLALSEKLARGGGQKYAGTIRRNLNELLRGALSELTKGKKND